MDRNNHFFRNRDQIVMPRFWGISGLPSQERITEVGCVACVREEVGAAA
jgi:hypothetical protein